MGSPVHFTTQMQVKVRPSVLACPKKSKQIAARSSLNEHEINDPLEVVDVDGEQLHLKHPYQAAPFVLHQKFVEPLVQ